MYFSNLSPPFEIMQALEKNILFSLIRLDLSLNYYLSFFSRKELLFSFSQSSSMTLNSYPKFSVFFNLSKSTLTKLYFSCCS
jgi:hypothetical protein